MKLVGNVGLVIAHPDDESMFFVPAIRSLKKEKYKVFILCLSTGNAFGKGKIRVKELEKAAKLLEIEDVEIIDDNNLPDSPNIAWDHTIIAEHVAIFVKKHEIKHILTFDSYGVSGHINHSSTFYGVKHYIDNYDNAKNNVGVQALQSIRNPLVAFIGPILLIFQSLNIKVFEWLNLYKSKINSSDTILTNFNILIVLQAMMVHYSQFEWYRVLFVLFSCFGYVNILKEINVARTIQ